MKHLRSGMLAQAGWIYKTSGLELIVLIGGSMTARWLFLLRTGVFHPEQP